ncbi:MAG: hypothetical protein LAO20_03260 [Acidobacteriia bacterium]|nr:hypothetical protein [Terriglobia bacterium]
MDFRRKTVVRLAGLVAVFGCLSGAGVGQKDKPNPDAIRDVVAQSSKSRGFCRPGGEIADVVNLRLGKELETRSQLYENFLKKEFNRVFGDAGPDPQAAYIFHVVEWKMKEKSTEKTAQAKVTKGADQDKQPILVSSDWIVYVAAGSARLKRSGFKGNGDPLIYGKKRAVVVGIDFIDEAIEIDLDPPTYTMKDEEAVKLEERIRSIYTTISTQGVPENQQDLGQLISALVGVGKQSPVGGAPPLPALPEANKPLKLSCYLVAATAHIQEGTKKLPFDLKVTAATVRPAPDSKAAPSLSPTPTPTPCPAACCCSTPTPKAPEKETTVPQNLSPGIVGCSGDGNSPPCAVTRTFTSDDREWWDVSIGVTTPGIRENQFSINNNALLKGATRHTDLYGLFDVFPAAAKLSKESWFPHFNVGIPVSSKSLYRPYFGMAENLTGWTHLQKNLNLPVGLNLFGGVIWLKTPVVTGNPTTTAQLTAATSTKRVWKGVFGIEVPVGSIASKIGKSGGSKNSSGSGKGGGGSGQ